MANPTSICPAPATSQLAIPRILHQTWMPPPGRERMSESVPRELAPFGGRWPIVLPHWERRMWSAAQNKQLWKEHLPELLDLYEWYPNVVQRSDASRLAYMHVFGGVYADLDVAPCDSISATMEKLIRGRRQLALVREAKQQGPGGGTSKRVSNFFLASAKGHPFWRYALGLLRSRASLDVMTSSGPFFVNFAWRSYLTASARMGCEQAVREGALLFSYGSWQREVGAQCVLPAGYLPASNVYPPSFLSTTADRVSSIVSRLFDPPLQLYLRVATTRVHGTSTAQQRTSQGSRHGSASIARPTAWRQTLASSSARLGHADIKAMRARARHGVPSYVSVTAPSAAAHGRFAIAARLRRPDEGGGMAEYRRNPTVR